MLFSFFYKSYGQTRMLDSLRSKIFTETNSEKKLVTLSLYAARLSNPDSFCKYIGIAKQVVGNDKERFADTLNSMLISYYILKNNFDSAFFIDNEMLAKYKDDKSKQKEYLNFLFLRAKIYDRNGELNKALEELADVVNKAENINYTEVLIQAKTGIGWVQMEMGQYKEALQWLRSALHASPNQEFYKKYAAIYSNIANAFSFLGNTDSAVHYINIAIMNAREDDNLLFLATSLSMQAKIYLQANQPKLAEAPLNEALAIRKQLNDPFYTVYDISTLASYYAANGNPEKAIELCKEGISLATKNNLSSQLLLVYESLAEAYKMQNNYTEYAKTLEHVIRLKDSFNTLNSGKLLADIQSANEKTKNEKVLSEQKLANARKNYWLYGIGIFVLLSALVGLFLFRSYRRKQKLAMQTAVLNAEELERKRIAADLHDNLGAYAASMASNLSYININEKDENSVKAISELKGNSNAIISQLNDTIWVLKKDALSLTAISDRIKTFISKIRNSYPGINIEVKENILQDHLLVSSQAFQLYRLLQEAINNALKHSKGKNIFINITSNDKWVASVKDDGAGMSDAAFSDAGNGLTNMKERAQDAGWKIEWITETGKGTEVVVMPAPAT